MGVDLSRKMAHHLVKENTAPLGQIIQKANQQRSILNSRRRARSRNSAQLDSGQAIHQQRQLKGPIGVGNRNRFSMSDVSDMLYEFYKANVAKAPKNQQEPQLISNKLGQTSPTSAETNEPSTIAAIATNSAAAGVVTTDAAIKTAQSVEQLATVSNGASSSNTSSTDPNVGNNAASFHPRIKYTNKSTGEGVLVSTTGSPDASAVPSLTAIPTSVVVMPPTSPQIDVKPLIHPTTGLVISPIVSIVADTAGPSSVIKSVPAASSAATAGSVVVPQAAAIAAALLRDGYHSFQQQLRAQELLKHQSRGPKQMPPAQRENATGSGNAMDTTTPTKILENFLRQHQNRELKRDDVVASDTNDGDDEDDSRYNDFEDIHLVEGGTAKHTFGNSSLPQLFQSAVGGAASSPGNADYMSDESQKYMIAAQAQAQALRNLEYSLGDYGGSAGSNDCTSPKLGPDGEPVYECCHCGKKYRWKSTLRRHENVECGGKEPGHQCPYCNYRSKQRGNLGVHVRKHHGNMPQLASKRRSKYSQRRDSGGGQSAHASDDSSSKLIIDCSK